MMKTAWCLWFLSAICFLSTSQACTSPAQTRLETQGKCTGNAPQPCRDVCTGKLIQGAANCAKAKHCCWKRNNCQLKRPTRPAKAQLTLEAISARFITTGRSVAVPPSPPPFGCVQYPDTCKNTQGPTFDPEAPVNIPYCQRIPCSATNNEILDAEFGTCLIQPGCAFDFELFIFRDSVGHAVLPGVPVCHLAIRNQAFHKRAQEYIAEYGPWAPSLTKCLLNEFRNETLANSPGCYMLNVLEHFGHKPKLAGWASINETECYLIDGCWRNNICVYPMSTEVTTTRSLNDNKTDIPEIFLPPGQLKCQELNDNSSEGDFLDQYHSCLTAGCAAGVARSRVRREILNTVFSYLPLHLQFHYWKMVQAGEVRPDNWKQLADELIADKKNLTSKFFGAVFPLGSQLNLPEGSTIRVVPFAFNLSDHTPTTQSPSEPSARRFGLFQAASGPRYTVNSAYPQLGTNASEVSGRSGTFPSPGGNDGFPSGVNLAAASSQLAGSGFATSALLLNFFNSPLQLRSPPPIVLPCPFLPFRWTFFPVLKGSYEGCCDKPLCYIPKDELSNTIRSGAASYLAGWGSWSPCSLTCGNGTSTRQRLCIGGNCGSVVKETQSCNPQSCAGWATWSAWSECSKTCGGGEQERSRTCSAGPGKCPGDNEESKPCNRDSCPHYGAWGLWSTCSAACGKDGTKTRHRICYQVSQYKCKEDKMVETEDCKGPCVNDVVNRLCDENTCRFVEWVRCQENLWTCRGGTRQRVTNQRCDVGRCAFFG